ncbi:DUF6927 domain-containing protein [Mycolicibacterium peregrinum]|uniref:DUF6927 domain-containing protein n=1 Tax=Mycolicibacterium peregrinum TaxID=43304 RepID=UPI0010567BEE|nr:hypothetical protein [Mycolicibacterium peregrinum]
MGSISYPIPAGSSARAEVAKYVRQGSSSVIASNYAPGDGGEWGGVYFAAHRESSGQVWASITLFGQHRGDVHIKAMSETMRPTAVGCGPRVLRALTEPAESEDARLWRQEAHRYQQKRRDALAARGHAIVLAQPVTLTNGMVLDTVVVDSLRCWSANDDRLRIRPPWDWFMRDWQQSP